MTNGFITEKIICLGWLLQAWLARQSPNLYLQADRWKVKLSLKEKCSGFIAYQSNYQQYNICQCHKPKLMAQDNLICTKLLMKVTQTEQITLCCYKKTKISPKWTDAIKQLKNVGYSMNIMMISWLNGAMLLIFYRFPIKGDCLEAEAL